MAARDFVPLVGFAHRTVSFADLPTTSGSWRMVGGGALRALASSQAHARKRVLGLTTGFAGPPVRGSPIMV